MLAGGDLNPTKDSNRRGIACGIPMRYLRTRVLRRMLRVRGVCSHAHTGAGDFQLLLVVGLIRQQHPDLAPAVEEQRYRTCPDYQH